MRPYQYSGAGVLGIIKSAIPIQTLSSGVATTNGTIIDLSLIHI